MRCIEIFMVSHYAVLIFEKDLKETIVNLIIAIANFIGEQSCSQAACWYVSFIELRTLQSNYTLKLQ